jgi:hypothetical protein
MVSTTSAWQSVQISNLTGEPARSVSGITRNWVNRFPHAAQSG